MSAIRLWVLVILVLAYAGLDVASDQGLCRQSCGDKPVPYPFGVDSNCGNPNFQGLLSCNDSAGFQDARLQLNTDSGNYDVSIDSSNHTISINDTTLLNCSTLEGPRSADFSRPDGRFNLSMRSSFIAFFHNDSKRPTYCDKSGSVTFSIGSCGGGPWNATYRVGVLRVFSPPCSNAASTLSFCITHLPPDGNSEFPYSSILYKTPHSGDGFSIVCSPTIVYSYNDTAAPAGIMRSLYPRLQPPQEPAETNPPGAVESPSSSSPSSAKNLGPVLGGVAAGGAGVASFILCLLLGYRRLKSWRSRRSHGKQMRNIAIIMDAGSGSSSDLTRFSYKELATATKNFDPEKRIGGGGFSVVYRGKLKDGRQVAVKKLHQANLQGRQQFMAELTVLSQAKHPNLVQLYGSCPEPRILVYEYVANGTLAEHLHGSRSVPFLNCRTRLSIAVEVAEALAYLHSLHPPIVHRDVKSSNILLDEGCRAKVGDFGLSRLHDVDRTHVSTAPQGTPGYLDPDYHQTYHLSDKSDVYSLGVVLMELVSGKKAVDMSRERGEINLSAMAAARIQSGATEELLDPGLASSAGGKDAVMALAELGFQCLATEKDDRPSMQEVVSKIKSIQYMAFAFPSPALSPLRGAQESSRLIKFKSEDWVPSESYPGLDVELQGR